VAILFNAADPQVNLERDAAQAAAQTLILDIIRLELRPGEDIAPAIESLKGRAEAVNVRLPLRVQPVNATPLVVYRQEFQSPKSFADVG
jgi:hypothetical protein